ncbi:MAG: DUF262 domain-containing protein [Hyphomicrobiaceae bacterium]|nr:DUF262 domain-containing protein [Hyphomicrobiaceae bacterium]
MVRPTVDQTADSECAVPPDQTEFDETKKHDQAQAEEQIRQHSRVVDYAIREYPIEVLVEKYLTGKDNDTNDIFVPDYQREFVWTQQQQSRFIESVLIGLPIPYLFVADVRSEDEQKDGRLEIVDGTQRIRTLAEFVEDKLTLSDLDKLPLLNGKRATDLLPSRQRRFKRTTIRLIELTEHADEETRRDMFDRINSGGEPLNAMETRRGVRSGKFIKFLEAMASNEKFRKLAPLSPASVKRRDYDELAVRFFAYTERYDKFDRRVIDFVNDYIDDYQNDFDPTKTGENLKRQWETMLDFVEKSFKYGFKKGPNNNKTPRVRFEAIAVGVALALQKKPKLASDPLATEKWAYGEEFNDLVGSDGANSRPRVKARIEFVRDKLLGA